MEDRNRARTAQRGTALIKFCGITRADDARHAAALDADYVGVIFAASPRQVDATTASAIFAAAGADVGRVAVFAAGGPDEICATAQAANAGIVQLHGRPGEGVQAREMEAIRRTFAGEIWAVVGMDPGDSTLPPEASALAGIADAVVLDARVAGRTGGTGVPLDWPRLAAAVEWLRERTTVILAGGLSPENVVEALRGAGPHGVDVSSGVEVSPGIKDHQRMQAFAESVRSASIEGGDGSSRHEAQ